MKPAHELEDLDEAQLEILKAVAQAWHGQTNKSSTSATEVDPCRRKFRSRPSRFQIERLRDILDKNRRGNAAAEYWDFGQSLWDSYEIVTVSKRLEDGMVLVPSFAKPYSRSSSDTKNIHSLRFLFNHMSSRRFAEPEET